MSTKFLTFQEIIFKLQTYWSQKGCAIMQPYDCEVGAGTFHPATFLRAIGPEPWSAAYVQGCRRPTDGRYGDNPNRAQHYFQFQVMIKPAPLEIQNWYIDSLRALGLNFLEEDLRFVEDNWESPTLGAWGLGWEVWLNGMEISQFTYFQQVGGLACNPITAEVTYGLERIAMYLQEVQNMYDLVWTYRNDGSALTYGQVYKQNEREQSDYNFNYAPIEILTANFDNLEKQCRQLIEARLVIPAYEAAMKASHTFNLLDARGAIAVTARQNYILRIRALTKAVAEAYYAERKAAHFPLV